MHCTRPLARTLTCAHTRSNAQARKITELGLVDDLLVVERAILYTLNFNVRVDLPFNPVVNTLAECGVYTFKSVKVCVCVCARVCACVRACV